MLQSLLQYVVELTYYLQQTIFCLLNYRPHFGRFPQIQRLFGYSGSLADFLWRAIRTAPEIDASFSV
jgi:hypothetical protein